MDAPTRYIDLDEGPVVRTGSSLKRANIILEREADELEARATLLADGGS
jgi:hypothetical protein